MAALTRTPDRCGYLQVTLYLEVGRPQKLMVHRLVLEAFVGPCPAGMECLHGDDDKANCALTNLKWGTHLENVRDGFRRGRFRERDRLNRLRHRRDPAPPQASGVPPAVSG